MHLEASTSPEHYPRRHLDAEQEKGIAECSNALMMLRPGCIRAYERLNTCRRLGKGLRTKADETWEGIKNNMALCDLRRAEYSRVVDTTTEVFGTQKDPFECTPCTH
eukprot:3941668-Amphidinium_carterae.1